jgi:hypothetical protein
MDELSSALKQLRAGDQSEAMELGEPAPEPRTPTQTEIFVRGAPEAHPLAIRPVKASRTLVAMPDHHENLLRPPFLMVVSAGVRSGKSVLIANLVYRKNYYRGIFKRIFLISPTAHADPTFKAFVDDPNCEVHAPSSREEFSASVEHIQKTAAELGPEEGPFLIVADDCAAFVRNGDALCQLATKYRHWGFSMIVSAQYYRMLPPVIRANTTALVLFEVKNSKERTAVFEENASTFGDRLEHVYNETMSKPYSFLVLDFRDRALLPNWQLKISV